MNFIGACVWRNGGQMSSRERAAAGGPAGCADNWGRTDQAAAGEPGWRTAGGPGGRADRADRAGACADQYLIQYIYKTIFQHLDPQHFLLSFLANFSSITPSP